jgi:hypothetical protein
MKVRLGEVLDDAGAVKDLPYGRSADLVAETGEFAVDTPVPQVGFSVARRMTGRVHRRV